MVSSNIGSPFLDSLAIELTAVHLLPILLHLGFPLVVGIFPVVIFAGLVVRTIPAWGWWPTTPRPPAPDVMIAVDSIVLVSEYAEW